MTDSTSRSEITSPSASNLPSATPADLAGPLRVLLIEHDRADVELCLRELKIAGYEVCADVVAGPEEFSERLSGNDYDIILADNRLPGWTGLEAFENLRELGKEIPFLLVTGTMGEEVAVECIKRGITDYVLKDRISRLSVAVQRALEEKALREENARATQALRESEASFRLLFADNPLPMWVYDVATLRFLQVNYAAVAHYGYSREEFLTLGISDILPAEDVPRLLPAAAELHQGIRVSGTWRHRVKDGRIITVELVTHTLKFAGHGAALVVAQDITERKRAEAENARLIAAIEQSAEGMLITDTRGKIQYVNPAFTTITGYGREEAIGETPRLFQSGQHDQAFYERLWNRILMGKIWRGEVVNRRKDGSLYTEEMSITPVRDAQGAITHFIAIKQDISERKRAEEALRQSEARYRELVENATYGIYRVTTAGRFLDVNPALVQMLGYASESELMSKSLPTDIYRDPADREKLVEQALRMGRVDGAEVQWKRKDAGLITVRLSGRTVFDKRAELEAFEVIAEDVTERRAMEKHIRQIQKFEAIGQLAGGIAHDFNNVMGAILGWAELGQEQAPADSSLRGYFEKIRAQTERATGLTRQLLAFARRQLLEPHNLNLNHVVAELLTFLEKVINKDIEVQTVLAPELGAVHADPSQIEQILMNLCLNARDAMPGGGRLVIETQNVEVGQDYYRLHSYARPGHYVQLSVSDNGVGMDAATIEHIFEPFFTTKELGKGTGLGLSTVYGVVKQHGGFLHVYSEPGQGTTFRVYLPAAGAAPAEVEPRGAPADQPVRGGTETILVAEDHDGVREMARMTLESFGYRLLLASDGAEALELFLAQPQAIALVVLDVVMPRLAGPDAYLKMCEARPGLPVIFTSGYSAEMRSLPGVLEQGAAALQKPYSPSVLGRKVREILDQAARQPCGPRAIDPSTGAAT